MLCKYGARTLPICLRMEQPSAKIKKNKNRKIINENKNKNKNGNKLKLKINRRKIILKKGE